MTEKESYKYPFPIYVAFLLFSEEDHREKGKLYKPSSRISDEKSTAEKAQEYAKLLASESKKDSLSNKKKAQEKKKSNLEAFKEELKQ